MEKVRDSQRGKVLDAIDKVFGHAIEDEEYVLKEYADCKDFFCKVAKSKWFQRNWEVEALEFRFKNGTPEALKAGDTLIFSLIKNKAITKDEALKLYAHALSPSNEPPHGRQFCRTYLSIVQHFLGKEVSTQLSTAFKEFGVKTRVRRELTEEQKKALKDRMMALRPWEKARNGKRAKAAATA
jgi:hypothetical protein